MSPNAYISFNDEGLLCGYPGEEEVEFPVFTWTYAEFEQHTGESITPSMYRFMAEYVCDNISKEDLYQMCDDYCPDDLNEKAVDAYYDLPINDRITMHEQELVNLKAAKRQAEAKESAAIDATLQENHHNSPIEKEYCEFLRDLVDTNRKAIDRLEREIHEEECWHGGYEEGASDLD